MRLQYSGVQKKSRYIRNVAAEAKKGALEIAITVIKSHCLIAPNKKVTTDMALIHHVTHQASSLRNLCRVFVRVRLKAHHATNMANISPANRRNAFHIRKNEMIDVVVAISKANIGLAIFGTDDMRSF